MWATELDPRRQRTPQEANGIAPITLSRAFPAATGRKVCSGPQYAHAMKQALVATHKQVASTECDTVQSSPTSCTTSTRHSKAPALRHPGPGKHAIAILQGVARRFNGYVHGEHRSVRQLALPCRVSGLKTSATTSYARRPVKHVHHAL